MAFPMVHHHRIHLVDVQVVEATAPGLDPGVSSRIGPSPLIIFVVVIPLDFTECFVDDELAGVVDVTGVVNDS